jgi:ATP phosphoribosyltransferase regulatory subunit
MSFVAEASPPRDTLAAIRAPFSAFGGEWVDAPVLQPLNLLLDLAGEAMRARLFVVQGEGTAEACLRPDFTIALAESHLRSGAQAGRYLYHGKAFRTAPRGSTRATEFWQLGAEVYGPSAGAASAETIAQDVEIAALAWEASHAGGRDDLSIMLGDVGLFAAFVTAMDLSPGASARLVRAFSSGRGVRLELDQAGTHRTSAGGRLADLLGDLPEAEATGVLEELWTLAGIQPVGGRSPAEIVHRLSLRADQARNMNLTPAEAELIGRFLDISGSPRDALDRVERLAYSAKIEFDVQLQPWVRRLTALVAAGVPEEAMTLAPGFARSFGYYDGALFEVRSHALGPDQPVAAGGRYDGLPGRLAVSLGLPSTKTDPASQGAVGCMVRPSRAWSGVETAA